MTLTTHNPTLPLVGISSCLTGNRVRYDGADKFNGIVAEHIQPFVNLLPLCPESMAGLGIPRPPVNLVQAGEQIRARGRDIANLDVTERLLSMGQCVANAYPELKGFIVQSRSPSCGFNTTPVYTTDQTEVLSHQGSGLFVTALLQCMPELPILNDSELTPYKIQCFLKQIQHP
ncbi:2-thiouracil desulfurase family protein [Ketobacter nezhaii]|uniref:DUF523 domain-containing protein n=1 Tax=Ketobacter sp. MCCC 1A13808 TaxID=2602738 RepID=UPI0018DC0495|nr:DUF523 domain-containing protein [Ketobacter sp. MCCC 1A13808]